MDGLLFTGNASNVAPSHYGAVPHDGMVLDQVRDATTLPLLRAAIAAGKPVLAICRGFQELNVALGGSLHQQLHAIPGRLDHREKGATTDMEYAPAHAIRIHPDGLLGRISGLREAMVNSLHHQGIDRLAPGLIADAIAPDARSRRFPGIPERFSWAFNGIRSGAGPKMPSAARSSRPLAPRSITKNL